MMDCRKYDKVNLKIFDTRLEMGKAAAAEAAAYICGLLEKKEEINCMFAAAPSQNEFLEALAADELMHIIWMITLVLVLEIHVRLMVF